MTSTKQFNNSLAPENRLLLSEELRSPEEYSFDSGIATTYSLDIETALEIPIHLALFARHQNNDSKIGDLPLLDSIGRIADNLIIFANIGDIKTRKNPASKLWPLMEDNIFELSAENNEGVFHPKIWILKYLPKDRKEPKLIRLLVLSRNITKDRSWDTILSLDGKIKGKKQVDNGPIANLLDKLPKLVKRKALDGNKSNLIGRLSKDVMKTEWEIPADFKSISFAVNGIDKDKWEPKKCDKLGVISPFCTAGALDSLAELSTDRRLIGRHEDLDNINRETLNKFNCNVMTEELLESMNDENVNNEHDISPFKTGLRGLHAKVYVAESGNKTEITVGSGNATDAGLTKNLNVEFFATLKGDKSKIGGVEEILGREGFGRFTEEFEPSDNNDDTPDDENVIEDHLDEAWKELCNLELKLVCSQLKKVKVKGQGKVKEEVNEFLNVKLVIPRKCELSNISNIQVWPVTLGRSNRKDALKFFKNGKNLVFESVQLVDLTRFVAFELSGLTNNNKTVCKTYCTGLNITDLTNSGVLDNRVSKIYDHFISDIESFFQFIRQMLSDSNDIARQPSDYNESQNSHKAMKTGTDMPLLEELLDSYCRAPEKIQRIARFINKMKHENSMFEKEELEDFRKQWKVFMEAIQLKKNGDFK